MHMKPETEKALRTASKELRQEILALLFEEMEVDDFVNGFRDETAENWNLVIGTLAKTMDAESFVAGLCDDNSDNLTKHGEAIHDFLDSQYGSETIPESDAIRLHEAICEGRRQDAVDILNEYSTGDFRSVREQANLFPDRCSIL